MIIRINMHRAYKKILKAISLPLACFFAFFACVIEQIRLSHQKFSASARFYHRLVSPSFLETPLTSTSSTKLMMVLNRFTAVDKLYWLLIMPILYT